METMYLCVYCCLIWEFIFAQFAWSPKMWKNVENRGGVHIFPQIFEIMWKKYWISPWGGSTCCKAKNVDLRLGWRILYSQAVEKFENAPIAGRGPILGMMKMDPPDPPLEIGGDPSGGIHFSTYKSTILGGHAFFGCLVCGWMIECQLGRPSSPCPCPPQIQRFRRHFDLQNDAILHLIWPNSEHLYLWIWNCGFWSSNEGTRARWRHNSP